ncbi:hypothetical protein ACFE04_030298 [Oxalis oulophora]
MESNLQSSPREDDRATKPAFRKPSSDVVNRKYRRRSPAAGGSSSPDGSPKHDGSSVQKRKDGSTELDKDAGRSQYGKSGDSHKHTDRQSSRGTHGHSRHDDYKKHDKYRDDEEKSHHRLSSRSNRESQDQHSRYESKHGRSRDYSRHVDKYSRDRVDDLSYRNKDMEKESSHSELSKDKDRYRRDFDGHHRKYDDCESKRDRNQQGKDHTKGKSVLGSDEQEPSVKKSKFSSSADHVKEVDEKRPSDSKQTQEISGQGETNGSEAAKDLDAAKVAAMKAAELVNKNLVGTGFMSTDQKKKLLWGNKKTAAAQESGHRWDTSSFGDNERQEKFNKLMGVKGDIKAENKSDQDATKQMELQIDLEKQYTAGLRRRDGRTVGLGL